MPESTQSDKYITAEELRAILDIGSISLNRRQDYLEEISKNKVVAAILSIATIGLPMRVENEITWQSQKTYNVSKALEGLLHTTPSKHTESEELLQSLMSDITIAGIQSATLRRLLPDLPTEAEAVVYIIGSRMLPEIRTNKVTCSCCQRAMSSVKEGEGVCTPCKSLLVEFTEYRAEAITIPINYFNVPWLTKGVSGDMNYRHKYSGWEFKKDGNTIIGKQGSPDQPRQLSLPLYEYQKRIIQ